MEKDARIVRLQARLATINSERAEIEAEISALAKQERMGPAETGKGEVRGTLGPALTASEKIALFPAYFVGAPTCFLFGGKIPRLEKVDIRQPATTSGDMVIAASQGLNVRFVPTKPSPRFQMS